MNKRLPAGRRVFCGTEGEELQELEEGYRKIVSIAIAVEKGDRDERSPFFVRSTQSFHGLDGFQPRV